MERDDGPVDFTKLLDIGDFRWPAASDVPFAEADAPNANATIAEDAFPRLTAMIDGYKMGADLMVVHAEANPLDRDDLVYPIIFNYRQFLELWLKYIIAVYGPEVDIKPVWNSHKLDDLWKSHAEILKKYGVVTDLLEADLAVAKIVLEFSKIDPDSFSYRYPVDTKGKPIPVVLPDLYLPKLADVMKAVHNYFSGCDGALTNPGG